ncbi:MAG: response regulator transcription factor [Ignavibacteriales bacterium]|nr:response regulator transcription factor [Ignavibacteriales bacterium]
MKRILVIENASEELKQIELLLPQTDFDIYFSHNKKDGLEIASRYLPDLILFFFSNGKNDLELIKKICNNEATANLPMIVISNNSSFEQQREVMELGADDYIPITLLEISLLNSVRKRFEKFTNVKIHLDKEIDTFDEFTSRSGNDDHVLVKIGNKLKLVKFSEMVCVTAMKEYSKIITKDGCKIIVRKSLRNWIKILPKNLFLQIHRATIINLDCIDKIVRTNERTYTVHLKNMEETFDFSHRYANIMRHTFPT